MSTPVLVYRALDANGDPIWGQGQANLLTNIDALGQLLQTRLKLFQGEWWADKSDGLALWQSILGVSANEGAIELVVSQRILTTTPWVTGLSTVTASFNSSTRQFLYSAIVQTVFGAIQVTNAPVVAPQGFPS